MVIEKMAFDTPPSDLTEVILGWLERGLALGGLVLIAGSLEGDLAAPNAGLAVPLSG